MLRNAHGNVGAATGDRARLDLRAHDAVTRTLDELVLLVGAGLDAGRGDVLSALDRAGVRGDAAGAPGRVAVLDLARARTRRFDVVVVLGLEQGVLPRRPRVEPFLDEDTRRHSTSDASARLVRPDAASRDRYLFATVLLAAAAQARARPAGRGRRGVTRARPGRSGRRSASSSTRTTSGTRRGDGRCPP
jgi:hypothetical protein